MYTIQGEGPVVVVPVTSRVGNRQVTTGMKIQFSGPTVQKIGNISGIVWTQFVEDTQGNAVSTYEQFTTDQSGNITGDGPYAFKSVVTFNNLTFRKQ